MKQLITIQAFMILAILLTSTGISAQPGSPLISPFPAAQADLTYAINNRRGTKDPFNVNPEEYRIMGIYKVKGNPMILRGSNATDVFMSQGYARNVNVVYDTYSQKFSVLIENNTQMLNIDFNELDSFRVNKDTAGLLKLPATFINATRIDKEKKFFVQRLTPVKRYTLYKSYKSIMVPSASDNAQTNLQQFELTKEYYYFDNISDKGYKKLKPNASFLKKEFKENPKAIDFLTSTSFDNDNKEASLIAFIEALN